jgi:hypothetical protein
MVSKILAATWCGAYDSTIVQQHDEMFGAHGHQEMDIIDVIVAQRTNLCPEQRRSSRQCASECQTPFVNADGCHYIPNARK